MDVEARSDQTSRSFAAETEDLVYAAAVLILSEDLYPRKLQVIREYIQNASDALDEFQAISDYLGDRAEPQIKLSIQGRSLLIFDNGIGMDEEGIRKLKRIAYSEKKLGEEAGYKGIGRLAGIAVADKLKISSTSYGNDRLYHFEFRSREMSDEISSKKKQGIQESATRVINRHTEVSYTEVEPESHYTLVELRDIRETCSDLLDPAQLREFIGEIAPVGFAPKDQFKFTEQITQKLKQNLPDFSPKKIYLSTERGERESIYKPYDDSMVLSDPDFIEVRDPDPPHGLLAFAWYASKGREMAGKIRPEGKIFAVEGDSVEEKRRFAGLVYKLFGFSVGDRTLPERTLWTTALPRARWFTGEIHIVDKEVLPTTDRSDFVPNQAKERLFAAARKAIPSKLIPLAQQISDNRQAYDRSMKVSATFRDYQNRLRSGGVDRADLKTITDDINKKLVELKKRKTKCTDDQVLNTVKSVVNEGDDLVKKVRSFGKSNPSERVPDIAKELSMTTKARKVFEIIMNALREHYATNKPEYYQIARKIRRSLQKRY